MTDLMTAPEPNDTLIPSDTVGHGPLPPSEPRVAEIQSALEKRSIHPNQPHLDALIHAKIVTHLIRVDAVPDTLFALSQMQEMPEVCFAAVFDDGLIALGCPDVLPEALATLATPAMATSSAPGTAFQGSPNQSSGQIDAMAERLERLLDRAGSEEIVPNDQLGLSILERLETLETRLSQPQTDVWEKFDALNDRLTEIHNLTDAGTSIDQHAQQEQLNQITSVITMFMQRLETTRSDMATQSNDALTQLADSIAARQDKAMSKLTSLLGKLDRRMDQMNPMQASQLSDIENTMATLVKTLQTSAASRPSTEPIVETIEQLGAAQRTAFNRVEAAMGKAVSGLEPALTHLNARAAETENMLSDWHRDLKTLSQRTRSIADNTGSLPSTLTTIQADLSTLANKPAAPLDLTAIKNSLSGFATGLSATLAEMKALTQQSNDRSKQAAEQSDETLATLQTLPSLMSAALRHDVDLAPMEQALSDLKTQLDGLPQTLKIPQIITDIASVSDQVSPIADAQALAFDTLNKGQRNVLAKLSTVEGDITGLHAKETDLSPVETLVGTFQKEALESAQTHDGQLNDLSETLARLTRHLGMAQQPAPLMGNAASLVPDSSLNTLRLEFADLITRRMKENSTALPPKEARRA